MIGVFKKRREHRCTESKARLRQTETGIKLHIPKKA
jgi:hypothetical protein